MQRVPPCGARQEQGVRTWHCQPAHLSPSAQACKRAALAPFKLRPPPCRRMKRCLLTVAGSGTRLFPVSREIPKELLPVPARAPVTRSPGGAGKGGPALLKPALQVIFETLYTHGVREYCFVTGRSKGAIEGHFTPDPAAPARLEGQGLNGLAAEASRYEGMLAGSTIAFVRQPGPLGFGDAVSRGRGVMDRGDGEPFILHAGDDVVVSEDAGHLRRLEEAFTRHGADIAFLVEDVDDPSQYGVVDGPDIGGGIVDVKAVHEKPACPPSRHAIVAIYMLKPSIFGYLDAAAGVPPGARLVEAFRLAVKDGRRAVGVPIGEREYRMDIGTHESYSRLFASQAGRRA